MKKITLAMLLLYTQLSVYSQITPTQQLNNIYADLDKRVMATGYLVNQQFSLVEPGLFQGSFYDTIWADINSFGWLYGAMYNSKTSQIEGDTLPLPAAYLDKIKFLTSNDTMPVAVMTWQYERILPEFAVENNLLSFSNGQFHDVPN